VFKRPQLDLDIFSKALHLVFQGLAPDTRGRVINLYGQIRLYVLICIISIFDIAIKLLFGYFLIFYFKILLF
jgi:hypothetical protein